MTSNSYGTVKKVKEWSKNCYVCLPLPVIKVCNLEWKTQILFGEPINYKFTASKLRRLNFINDVRHTSLTSVVEIWRHESTGSRFLLKKSLLWFEIY